LIALRCVLFTDDISIHSLYLISHTLFFALGESTAANKKVLAAIIRYENCEEGVKDLFERIGIILKRSDLTMLTRNRLCHLFKSVAIFSGISLQWVTRHPSMKEFEKSFCLLDKEKADALRREFSKFLTAELLLETRTKHRGLKFRQLLAEAANSGAKTFVKCNNPPCINNGIHKCPCKTVSYCCSVCQDAHWKEHKGPCIGMQGSLQIKIAKLVNVANFQRKVLIKIIAVLITGTYSPTAKSFIPPPLSNEP
jgi:hypothetical protein